MNTEHVTATGRRRRSAPQRRRGDSGVCRRLPSLASFYRGDPRRLPSRETDVGLWWREAAEVPLYRAAWVHDTGELYLVRLGPAQEGGGEVEVLCVFEDRARMERTLAGWRGVCGSLGSLDWLRRRAACVAPAAVAY